MTSTSHGQGMKVYQLQKASQALNERGERLGRAEEKTEELKNSAQQFAETAHKVRFWWSKVLSSLVYMTFLTCVCLFLGSCLYTQPSSYIAKQ
uniref:V-SNARE coiled-coil homology domain-containing protein n=1 Tax=Pavo cristatus TaxID=9049 RepID=A0A8C9F7I8_PAVCR